MEKEAWKSVNIIQRIQKVFHNVNERLTLLFQPISKYCSSPSIYIYTSRWRFIELNPIERFCFEDDGSDSTCFVNVPDSFPE